VMEILDVRQVVVCGAGTMGSGIAWVCAMAGFETILFDTSSSILEKAAADLEKQVSITVSKGKISQETADASLARLKFTDRLEDCKGELIIEAIVEKLEVKQLLFGQLAALNDPETILASNTSSLSISRIAEDIPQPQRVAGIHFFNPAPLMPLVEIVKGKDTEDAVIHLLESFVKVIGKTPVTCADSPGFIVNRVARHYYLEALRLVEKGVADFEKVDRLMEASGFRMGPFGNDVNYAVTCSVYEALGKPVRLRPSPIQKGLVENGHWGRKTGRGYYTY
jgi:3-hydroxybutyryl-CoA dehydrogenase